MEGFASVSCSSLCCPCGQGCCHIKSSKDGHGSLEPCFQASSCSLVLTPRKIPGKCTPFCYVLRLTWYHGRNPILCIFLSFQSLRLSSSVMGKTTTGKIVNLLSNDVNRFDQVSCPRGILFHFLSSSLGLAYWAARYQGLVSARVLLRT